MVKQQQQYEDDKRFKTIIIINIYKLSATARW